MTHGNEETGTLQLKVGIDVDKRITSQFNTTVWILLDGKLSDLRQVVRSIVFGEIGGTSTQLDVKYTGYLKLQEEV